MTKPTKRSRAKAAPKDASTEALIAEALRNRSPMPVIERLIALREQHKLEATRRAFFDALGEFQSRCPVIYKTKTGTIKTENGETEYTFAPFEEIQQKIAPLCHELGFTYTFDTEIGHAPPSQSTICRLHHIDGHTDESGFTIPVEQKSYASQPQKNSSAMALARRHALCNAFAIVTVDEDNDGKEADGADHSISAIAEAKNKTGDFLLDIFACDTLPVLAQIFDTAQNALRDYKDRVPREDIARLVDRLTKAKELRAYYIQLSQEARP